MYLYLSRYVKVWIPRLLGLANEVWNWVSRPPVSLLLLAIRSVKWLFPQPFQNTVAFRIIYFLRIQGSVTFKKVVTMCSLPLGLTLKNYTFCQHNACVYALSFSEQIWIFPPSRPTELAGVFKTERESVYCAIRTQSLNIIQVHYN